MMISIITGVAELPKRRKCASLRFVARTVALTSFVDVGFVHRLVVDAELLYIPCAHVHLFTLFDLTHVTYDYQFS